MSKKNLSTNVFKRFFVEKTYESSFNVDRVYEFDWKVKSYNIIGVTKDGQVILDVTIEIIHEGELKKNFFKKYKHQDKILFLVRKRLDNLSDFLGIFVRNITID